MKETDSLATKTNCHISNWPALIVFLELVGFIETQLIENNDFIRKQNKQGNVKNQRDLKLG